MPTASLLLNIAVLIPVCFGLLTSAPWVSAAYGEATQARGILLAVYMAIAIASALLLFIGDTKMIAALLLVQVIYKVLTPWTVGTFGNPVVISNLFIAAFHAITLAVIWRSLST